MTWYNKYIGIPFKEKGRDIDGVDCYGLLCLIYKEELGIILPDFLDVYESVNDREVLKAAIEKDKNENWIEPVFGAKEFDVVILKMAGVPIHLGIVTKSGQMIHCAKDINTVHESYTGMRWQNKVMGFNRYDGAP